MDGARDLVAGLEDAASDLARLEDTAGAEAAELLAARALSRTPRRSGRLAGTVRAAAPGTVTAGGPAAPYAPYVHYGTRYMRGRPFLTETLDDTTPAVVALYATAITETINRI